jgi:hypothetical protein
MSVCKQCAEEMFEKSYSANKTYEKAFMDICRKLNVRYDEEAIENVKTHIETSEKNGKLVNNVFGLYFSKISSLHNSGMDLTFFEPIRYSQLDLNDENTPEIEQLKDFWGGDYPLEDYIYLEKRLAEWKASFACDNKAQEFYIKQACFKELELEKKRGTDLSIPTDAIMKSMNELLSKAALTPAQANAASNGQNVDTVGMIIKRMEAIGPAEYYKDKGLFKDFDNLLAYIVNYIKRPIINVLTGNKNFQLIGNDESELEEEISIQE